MKASALLDTSFLITLGMPDLPAVAEVPLLATRRQGNISQVLHPIARVLSRIPPLGDLRAHPSYATDSNVLRALHRLTNANSVVTCAAFLA
ncbi:hypothetical protein, partial [Xanthomonas hyacinthi]